MNISWNSHAINKKRLGFGLNPRASSSSSSGGAGRGVAALPPGGNVFGDDEDDDDDHSSSGGTHGGTMDARKRINREIVKEQAAVRQRALKAAEQAHWESTHNKASGGDNNSSAIYDYDGAYDSFTTQPSASTQQEEGGLVEEHRKSRYIGNLLETAKKRQQEREAVMERKIAKEQAVEDAQEDFAGKEKFVTKAYRRKLEERQQWQVEEDAKDKEESANDVTQKTTAGAAMARFYGNFSNNVAVGGTGKNPGETTKALGKVEAPNRDDNDFCPTKGGRGDMGFMAGFERSEPVAADVKGIDDGDGSDRVKNINSSERGLTLRHGREQKVAAARQRYLKRKAAVAASN